MTHGNLRTLVIVVLILFIVYLIMKIRHGRIQRKRDDRDGFRLR